MSPSFIFRVNRIVREVETEVGLDTLGPRARTLLRLVAEESASGSALITADLLKQNGLGTPPTVFAGLDKLEEGGWIERRADKTDLRARRLHLTARAKKAFARMSRLIEKEAQPSVASPDEFRNRKA